MIHIARIASVKTANVLRRGLTRLQENSRRPQSNEMRSIFAGLGLEGDFGDPQSDRFG